MEKQNQAIRMMREVWQLVIKFFKSYGIPDEVLEIPANVKRMGLKVRLINFGMTILALGFAFMLKLTNLMIEQKFILLGIIFFMLYRGQAVIREAGWMYEGDEAKKFDLIYKDEIILKSSPIIGKVANKVLKFDSSDKVYRVMNNEALLNTIKNYLDNLWRMKIQRIFDMYEICSVVVMLIVAVVTNTSISQGLFIPMIIVFVIIAFFTSAYTSINRKEFYTKSKQFDNEQSVIMNDMLRVPCIVKNDIDMRISRLQKSVTKSNENVTRFHKKMNNSRFFVTIMEALSQYGVIIFYLLGVKWSSISLATITEITATLLVVETALGQISRIAETLNGNNERVTAIEKEEADMKLILEVFHKENEKINMSKPVENIEIAPFSIQYLEESENDKPFTLTSKDMVHIDNGEIAILYGPSGSGKSTFMKMLTERIRIEKTVDIPSTSRYMFFDEKLKFGSQSIYDEIFCCTEYPDLAKMQCILENLHLWSEIKANCFDIWQWMKEKQFEQSLSNGQKQRLILAKMLYWMDDEIDVLVLDECTSGLDDKSEEDSADAERILEYIVRYANSDKKRIVIISTHQNIDGFKENLSDEYTFRNLQFTKEGDCNTVKEI